MNIETKHNVGDEVAYTFGGLENRGVVLTIEISLYKLRGVLKLSEWYTIENTDTHEVVNGVNVSHVYSINNIQRKSDRHDEK